METDTFTANNGIVRHVFSMNSIPDHHAWGMSGTELKFRSRIQSEAFEFQWNSETTSFFSGRSEFTTLIRKRSFL